MLRRLFPIRQLYTTTRAMASKSTDPTSLHNPYFYQNRGKRYLVVNQRNCGPGTTRIRRANCQFGTRVFSYNPPEFAINAVEEALTKPQFNQYAHARGNPNLLKQVAEHYSRSYGRDVGLTRSKSPRVQMRECLPFSLVS